MSLKTNAVFAVLVMSVVGMVSTQAMTAYAQTLAGGFASITTEQTGDKIVITIVREPGSTPTDGNVTLPEVPEGPIIIVPDPSGEGNGTVIVPEPSTNETTTGNVTEPEQPVVVIPPDGNVTQVEQPTNVTIIDNDTVIVTPPTDNITEIPIGEPTGNETAPPVDEVIVITPTPEPCGCPAGNETTDGGVSILPGEEVPAAGNETAEPAPAPGDDNATAGEPTLPIDETSSQPVDEQDVPPEFSGQN